MLLCSFLVLLCIVISTGDYLFFFNIFYCVLVVVGGDVSFVLSVACIC